MRLNFLFLGLLLSTISYSQGNETSSIATQIDSLTSISNAHVKSRNWEKAVEASSSALQLAKDSYGRESKQYAECCYMLGLIYFNTRDLVNVEKWWLDAKLIREMVLSDEDPELARSLNDLGGLYLMQGKFEQGRLFLHQAKDIRKKLKVQHRRDYAGTLINLAVVYREIGQYKDSEDLFLEARQLFESGELDRDDGFYINCLGNLAILYSEEALYELEKLLGKLHRCTRR